MSDLLVWAKNLKMAQSVPTVVLPDQKKQLYKKYGHRFKLELGSDEEAEEERNPSLGLSVKALSQQKLLAPL